MMTTSTVKSCYPTPKLKIYQPGEGLAKLKLLNMQLQQKYIQNDIKAKETHKSETCSWTNQVNQDPFSYNILQG